MDYTQPLDFLPIWAVYLLTVLFALLFVEIGYRLGSARKKRLSLEQVEKERDLGSIVGATFGLMAFLLVFLIGNHL